MRHAAPMKMRRRGGDAARQPQQRRRHHAAIRRVDVAAAAFRARRTGERPPAAGQQRRQKRRIAGGMIVDPAVGADQIGVVAGGQTGGDFIVGQPIARDRALEKFDRDLQGPPPGGVAPQRAVNPPRGAFAQSGADLDFGPVDSSRLDCLHGVERIAAP